MKLLTENHSSYRPDIDGLRAIAVLSVIIFHIDKGLLPGGFVGVDIFFVISGYLITKNILQQLENDSFSLLDFYKRRVQRIAPAMFVLVFIVSFLSQFLLLPGDSELVAESGLWSVFSLANVYFWLHQDTGYFAEDSNQLPLLHLWSLGVEEQFYIFWPVLLMAFYAFVNLRWFLPVTILIASLSYIFAESILAQEPSFAYYMLPSRAGELLLGAIGARLVLNGEHLDHIPAVVYNVLSVIGLVLIIYSLFLISEDSGFPGYNSLPPTLGSALVILGGHRRRDSIVSWMLSNKLFVGIGLVSYSAYLWHWPLLALFRYGHIKLSLLSGFTLFLLTFVIAYLSYKYVEKPFRKYQTNPFKVIIKQFAIPSLLISMFSLFSMYIDGYGYQYFISDYRSDLQKASGLAKNHWNATYICENPLVTNEMLNDKSCITGSHSGKETRVLIWGDSNAGHYVPVLKGIAKKAGYNFRNISHSGCPPILYDADVFKKFRLSKKCEYSLKLVYQVLSQYDVVIMSASWTTYMGNDDEKLFRDKLHETIGMLTSQQKRVVLLGKIPIFKAYDHRCREKRLRYPFLNCVDIRAPINKQVAEINEKLEKYALPRSLVSYYDFNEFLCPQGICSPFDRHGGPIYSDPIHLSLQGAERLGKEIAAQNTLPYILDKWIKNGVIGP